MVGEKTLTDGFGEFLFVDIVAAETPTRVEGVVDGGTDGGVVVAVYAGCVFA